MDLTALRDLIDIDSPTGMTNGATDFIVAYLNGLGLEPVRTTKGAIRCALGENPILAVTAHIDTLGAMVSKIRSDGALVVSPLGGLSFNMIEGEYVRVHTLDGGLFTGAMLLNNPSMHANAKHAAIQRSPETMHVRLDEIVATRRETEALGVRNGDFVCFEPRYQETPSGFIKARYLDNKAGCFVLLEVARRLTLSGKTVPVELFFSTYEEVGHGGATRYGGAVQELLVIDMGVVGDPCDGRETACSICAKDRSGPYDLSMRRKLIECADVQQIPYVVDIYPFYSSDGSAAWRAGRDLRVALIGPGVAASHGVERTHRGGIAATIDLTLAYIACSPGDHESVHAHSRNMM
jgi:putative aminopeptidase FrvX